MNLDQTLNIYLNLMNNNKYLLNIEENIKNYLYDKNFILNSFNLFNDPKYEIKVRIYIGIILKNISKNYYKNNLFFNENKIDLANFLIKSLIENFNNKIILNSISLIISEILKNNNEQELNIWIDKINYLIDYAIDNDELVIFDNLIDFLNIIFDKTDDNTYIFVKVIFNKFYEIFTNIDEEKIRTKIIILIYQGFLKINILESINFNLLEDILKDNYNLWMGIFVSILSTPIKNMITTKYYVIKILDEIVRDFKKINNEIIFKIIPIVWKNLNGIFKLFVWQECLNKDINGLDKNLEIQNNELEYIFEGWDEGYELEENFFINNSIQGLSYVIIKLFNSLILDKRLDEFLYYFNLNLIHILSHFLLITHEEITFWEEEPNQYISNEENIDNMTLVKNSALNAIYDMIEMNENYSTQNWLTIINKWMDFEGESSLLLMIKENENLIIQKFGNNSFNIFQNISFYFNNKTDYLMKKLEVGLLLIGQFSEDIIYYYIEKGILNFNNTLINEVNDLLNKYHDNNLIVGRIIWVIFKLYKNNINDLDLFYKLYKNITNFLNIKYPLTIRLSASKTTTVLSYKISKNNLQNEIKNLHLNHIEMFNSICQLLNLVNEDTIHIILDNFILFLDIYDDLINIAKEFIPNLFMIFYKQYNDELIGKILMELFKKLINNKFSIESFINYFLSNLDNFTIKFILNIKTIGADNFYCNDNNETDFLYYLFDLFNEIIKSVYKFNGNYEIIKNSIYNLNELINYSKDPSIIIKLSIMVKNSILFFNKFDINLKKIGQELVIKLINPDEDSSKCSYLGNLLMVYMEIYGFNIELWYSIINKLDKTTLPSINQGICVMFSKLMINDFNNIFNYLSNINIKNKSGIKILLNHWLLHQPNFIGKNTKNLTSYLLYKIFILHEERIDNMLTISYNPSHSNNVDIYVPLKILSILINSLENEINSKNILKNKKNNEFKYEERLETFNEKEEENYDLDLNIEVGINENEIIDNNNYKENDNYAKSNNSRSKRKGLVGMESGSKSYMSGLLGFDLIDNDECDETTEEDILFYFSNKFNEETDIFLKNMLVDISTNDKLYFKYFNMLPIELKNKFNLLLNDN